jgi:hypothetical protein
MFFMFAAFLPVLYHMIASLAVRLPEPRPIRILARSNHRCARQHRES